MNCIASSTSVDESNDGSFLIMLALNSYKKETKIMMKRKKTSISFHYGF